MAAFVVVMIAATVAIRRHQGETVTGEMTTPQTGIIHAPFGTTPDGQAVTVFTLSNAHHMEVRVMTYGGIILSIKVPDRDDKIDDVVLGYDSLADYVRGSPYFGAIVGRYGNRIGKAHFALDGKDYLLAANNGPNALHGGLKGFDKVVWQARTLQNDTGVGLVLRHTSPDGDQGYPGTLVAQVTYILTDSNQLIVEYHATTDKATPVNLTNHTYFNLAGAGKGNILGHILTLDADRMTPVDSMLIPLGTITPVAGTPFDFRKPTPIGARIDNKDKQLKNAGGYDHNMVINRTGPGLVHFAHVVEPTSGRTLDVSTTEPGVQFYTGNFLDGSNSGKNGIPYMKHFGFCLETQHFPDSPNRANFPSTILRPGATYDSQTIFAFGVAAAAQ